MHTLFIERITAVLFYNIEYRIYIRYNLYILYILHLVYTEYKRI